MYSSLIVLLVKIVRNFKKICMDKVENIKRYNENVAGLYIRIVLCFINFFLFLM